MSHGSEGNLNNEIGDGEPESAPRPANVSPCWEDDGTFHAVCIVVISVGIVVAIVTFMCTRQIIKLCLKLRSDGEKVELEMKMLRESAESAEARKATVAAQVAAAAAAGDTSSAPAVASQEETTVTNVDSIHTIETSFVTSTAV